MIWRKAKPEVDVDVKPKGFDDYELRLGDIMRGERATLGKSLLDVQRELKIKATYIAAIENTDLTAFPTIGFVAGYVRSYARYLGMDPDRTYEQFCAEAGHAGMGDAPIGTGARAPSRPRPRGLDALADPEAMFIPRGRSWTSRIEPGAAGSVLVLLMLIAGIGYGGWSVLREVQRVQVAPVEQAPSMLAALDPLATPGLGGRLQVAELEGADQALAPTAEALGRLYRPQALDMPQMVSRDGPIAAIVPPRQQQDAATQLAGGSPATDADPEGPTDTPVVVLAEVAPAVELMATSPSWVRVRAADGTVLFEKILEKGETYVVPQGEAPATLRAGNAGAVYFMVKGEAYGPASGPGKGGQVVNNVALSPEALGQRYARVDLETAPEVSRMVQLVTERHLGAGEQPAQ